MSKFPGWRARQARGSATRRRLFAAVIPAISIVGEDFRPQSQTDAPAVAGRRAFTRLRDDEEMPLICPTCQVALSNGGGRLLLCMGLFSIF
jgi:hypothetical protein